MPIRSALAALALIVLTVGGVPTPAVAQDSSIQQLLLELGSAALQGRAAVGERAGEHDARAGLHRQGWSDYESGAAAARRRHRRAARMANNRTRPMP